MDLCSVLRVRTGRLKENELVHRIRPPFIARFHVSAYQFVLSFGYAFRKFYQCKCVLMNTRVFRLQVSDTPRGTSTVVTRSKGKDSVNERYM